MWLLVAGVGWGFIVPMEGGSKQEDIGKDDKCEEIQDLKLRQKNFIGVLPQLLHIFSKSPVQTCPACGTDPDHPAHVRNQLFPLPICLRPNQMLSRHSNITCGGNLASSDLMTYICTG
jgi:hypothetical protein